MKEKLLELINREGLKPSQLAEILGVNPAGISHILAGRNKPGFDMLQKILRNFPRLNPDWLLLDSDKMYRDESVGNAAPKPSHQPSRSSDLFGSQPTVADAAKNAAAKSPAVESLVPQLHTTSNVKRIIILYEDQTFESFTPTAR